MVLTTPLTSPPGDVNNSTHIIQPSDSLMCAVCVGCRLGFLLFVVVVFLSCSKLRITRMTVWKMKCKKKRHFEVTVCSLFCVQDLLQEVKHLKKKVEELEGEKGQYERKLRGTKVFDERTHTARDPTAVCVR